MNNARKLKLVDINAPNLEKLVENGYNPRFDEKTKKCIHDFREMHETRKWLI